MEENRLLQAYPTTVPLDEHPTLYPNVESTPWRFTCTRVVAVLAQVPAPEHEE